MSILLDVAIAFTHLILAARTEGIGTCWIGAFNNNEIKKLLKVPNGYEVVAATPLGYPSDVNVFTESKNRKDLEEVVSTDKFQVKLFEHARGFLISDSATYHRPL